MIAQTRARSALANAPLTLRPLTFREACDLVHALHRRPKRPTGHKCSIGVVNGAGQLVAAMVGRPAARHFDDGLILDTIRLVTDGTRDCASKLLGAVCRAAGAVGHQRLITYTHATESGASLRGAGWVKVLGPSPRRGWDTLTRPRPNRSSDHIARFLWQVPGSSA